MAISLLRHRFIRYVLIGLAILIGADAILVIVKWPFKREAEIRSLSHFAQSQVAIGKFENKLFPQPGFDAEDVVFMRKSGGKTVTLAWVRHIRARSTWFNLFTYTHRVIAFDLNGLHVVIPKQMPAPMRLFPNEKASTTVTNMSADGSVLDVRQQHFVFPRLRLSNVGKGKAIRYDIQTEIPEPKGALSVVGRVGPFGSGGTAKLPLSGTFKLRQADLQSVGNLAGLVSADGTYGGVLSRVGLSGTAHVRAFHLRSVPNPVDLSGQYGATVDGQHGNVRIQHVQAQFGQTNVSGDGSITDKILNLQLSSRHARLEDLLMLVSGAQRPPATGEIRFRTAITVPPGKGAFLQRLRMAGEFDIHEGRFASKQTQDKLDELSERARSRGEKKGTNPSEPPLVEANVEARFRDENGLTRFPLITFEVPSARARADGTFNLLTQAIDLNGTLAMKASLSGAAGGIKAVLLAPLDPFFKKGSAGAVIGILVRGTYSHPVFKASLRKK